ncbi:MAG: hypothetical protein AAFN77_24220 [Planctomycetota bacterium]
MKFDLQVKVMKVFALRFRYVFALTCVLVVFFLAIFWFLEWNEPNIPGKSPDEFVDWLKPRIYQNNAGVKDDELKTRLHDWLKEDYTLALGIETPYPNTADNWNRVPVIRHGEDMFVVTWKQGGYTSGLAISSRDDFVANSRAIVEGITLWPIKQNVFGWSLKYE